MRPKTKRWRKTTRQRKPAKWRLSPSEKSSALTWQARGGQHQNTPAIGRIFSKLWSDPHTASMPILARACEASHPHSKQREEDGKSEVWPPESETMWTRPWECNQAWAAGSPWLHPGQSPFTGLSFIQSVRCRREPIVSPNMWSAGGKRTDCRGGKPNTSPNCQKEEKLWWTLSAHQTSRGGCDRSEWGERVWGGQIRFCGLVSPRSDEKALLIPTRGSGTTWRSLSGGSAGPLQVNHHRANRLSK